MAQRMTGLIYVGAHEPTVVDDELADERRELEIEQDALLFDIACSVRNVANAIAQTIDMHHEDCADRLGQLLDEHDKQRARLVTARDVAYSLAGSR